MTDHAEDRLHDPRTAIYRVFAHRDLTLTVWLERKIGGEGTPEDAPRVLDMVRDAKYTLKLAQGNCDEDIVEFLEPAISSPDLPSMVKETKNFPALGFQVTCLHRGTRDI